MDKIKTTFSLKNKNKDQKWLIGIILSFFCCGVALFIITSWFKYDQMMSDFFGRAIFNTNTFWSTFFRSWSTYFILDAYRFYLAFALPLVMIIVESFWIWFKRAFPNLWISKQKHIMFLMYFVLSVMITVYVWKEQYFSYFCNLAFGEGFYTWTMVDWGVLVPCYVISCLIITLLNALLCTYVHKHLVKRPDFISSGYWKIAFADLIFIVCTNFFITNELKSVLGRPYEVNIKWEKWSNKIKELYPDRYDYYIHQGWNWGWNDGTSMTQNIPDKYSFPWYKKAKGTNIDSPIWNNLPGGDAFPSGHINVTLFDFLALYTIFRNPSNKKEKIIDRVLTIACLFYLLNMIFVLEITWNHWMSDMAFPIVIDIPIYAICTIIFYAVYFACKYVLILFIYIHTNIYIFSMKRRNKTYLLNMNNIHSHRFVSLITKKRNNKR